jgi:lipopolysaccharide export system protein LptA
LVLGLALATAVGAHAERADRNQPMVVGADRSGTLDLQRQVLLYEGNVSITQGSMLLRAERVELRELADGYRAATATGAAGKPASWRQRRDGVDEVVEGSAGVIEFDGHADTLRFVGNAAVRRLRGAAVADEITGAVIVWDNQAEVFKVEGGGASAANPSGRVRAVLSPRAVSPTAGEAAAGEGPSPSRGRGLSPRAEPPATAASAAPAKAAPLAPSRTLGERR